MFVYVQYMMNFLLIYSKHTFFRILAKEKRKRKKKKANIAQIENVEFDDEENGGEPKTSNEGENNDNSNIASADVSYSNTSLRLTSRDRETSESSRRQDDGFYKSPYGTNAETGEIDDNSRSITNSATNSSVIFSDQSRKPNGSERRETNPRNDFALKISKNSELVPENGTNTLLDKTNKNNKQLSSFESIKTGRNSVNADKALGNAAKLSDDNSVRTAGLSRDLENSDQNTEQDTSGEFADETVRDDPLVDLNSGVALTPVACPDEARDWALQESDDSESPGNEGVVENSFLVNSRLFGGSSRESPASR